MLNEYPVYEYNNEWLTLQIPVCNGNYQIGDICSGSGNIALALAWYCKNSQVVGCDINNEALRVCIAYTIKIFFKYLLLLKYLLYVFLLLNIYYIYFYR